MRIRNDSDYRIFAHIYRQACLGLGEQRAVLSKMNLSHEAVDAVIAPVQRALDGIREEVEFL